MITKKNKRGQCRNKQLLTICSLLFSTALSAQTEAETAGMCTIEAGNVTMTVDPGAGGKIMSLRYGDAEVISQSRWPESFGSTFWTSPQKEWNWPPVPEIDKRPYTVEQREPSLVMTSQLSERLGYRVRKEFTASEPSGAIVVTYSVINEGREPRSVAPWEITRVPNEGLIFFDAPVDKITPQGLMAFSGEHGAAWYQADQAPQNRKVNADGKGWLAYANKGLLLVKQFPDLDASQPAPDEAEIPVYVNRGTTYIELESQGAYTLLKPGESLSWTVRWFLVPFDGDAVASEALLKQVQTLMGKSDI